MMLRFSIANQVLVARPVLRAARLGPSVPHYCGRGAEVGPPAVSSFVPKESELAGRRRAD